MVLRLLCDGGHGRGRADQGVRAAYKGISVSELRRGLRTGRRHHDPCRARAGRGQDRRGPTDSPNTTAVQAIRVIPGAGETRVAMTTTQEEGARELILALTVEEGREGTNVVIPRFWAGRR